MSKDELLGKMFRDLNKDRGINLIENNYGFATYYVLGKECVLMDFFTEESQRQKGIASNLFLQIVKDVVAKGCDCVSSKCDLKTKGANSSIMAHLKNGFIPVRASNDVIYFFKELK